MHAAADHDHSYLPALPTFTLRGTTPLRYGMDNNNDSSGGGDTAPTVRFKVNVGQVDVCATDLVRVLYTRAID